MKKVYILIICVLLALATFTIAASAMSPLDDRDSLLDLDNDGLTNVEEFDAETDPGNPDTDGDGMPDGWEYDYGLDPNDPKDAFNDEDYDGGEEYAYFTQVSGPHYTNLDEYNRYVIYEGVKIKQSTNPLKEDSDGDGVLDPDDPWPLTYGIKPPPTPPEPIPPNPIPPYPPIPPGPPVPPDPKDTDGDGLYDYEELEIGSDYLNPDTDGDGLNDYLEVRLGLDANDWDSDNDLLQDGAELGIDSDSTDGHVVDSDNDGL